MGKLLLVGALALAAACTSNGGEGAAQEAPATTETTVAPTSTTLREEGTAGPQVVGRPFRFDLKISETEKTVLRLTVRRPIVCGIKGFALPTNPYTGEAARTIRPRPGTRFCHVTVTAKNVGKRETEFGPGGYMYDERNRQFQHDEETTVAVDDVEPDQEFLGVNDIKLSPEESGDTIVIFPLPVGAAPAYVELAQGGVTEDVYGGQHGVRVDIVASDISWKNPRGK